MGNIEEASSAAGRKMFGDRTSLVLNRHVPPTEIHHSGAGLHMPGVEYRLLKRFHFATHDTVSHCRGRTRSLALALLPGPRHRWQNLSREP